MANKIEDSDGNNITLNIFGTDLQPLKQLFPLPKGLPEHLLVGFQRI